jgi:hypothetical protein
MKRQELDSVHKWNSLAAERDTLDGISDAAFHIPKKLTDNLLGSWPLNTEKMRGTYAKES